MTRISESRYYRLWGVAFFFFENWTKGIEFEGNGGNPRSYSEEAWGEMSKFSAENSFAATKHTTSLGM